MSHAAGNRRRKMGCWAIFLAISPIACARKSLDLQAPAHIAPSKDPTVIGTIDEQVGQIAVDDERLYWFGSQGENPSAGGLRCAAARNKTARIRSSPTIPEMPSRARGSA